MFGGVRVADGDRRTRIPAVGELQQHEIAVRVVSLFGLAVHRQRLLHCVGIVESRLQCAEPLGVDVCGCLRVQFGVSEEVLAASELVELPLHVGEFTVQGSLVDFTAIRHRHPVAVADPVGMLGHHIALLLFGQRIPPGFDIAGGGALAIGWVRRRQARLFTAHLLGAGDIRRPLGGDVSVLDMAEHLGAVGIDVLGLMDQCLGPRFDVVGDGPQFVAHVRWRVDRDVAVVGESQVAALRGHVGADRFQFGVQLGDGGRGLGGQLVHRADHRRVVEHLAGRFGDLAARGIRGRRIPAGQPGDQLQI